MAFEDLCKHSVIVPVDAAGTTCAVSPPTW